MAEGQTIIVGQQPIAPQAGVRQTTTPTDSPRTPSPPARPAKRNPKLSHDDMVRVIRSGGSILHAGEAITQEHLLPTEDEIAKGDADREETAKESLDAQIAALSRRRAALDASAASAPASTATHTPAATTTPATTPTPVTPTTKPIPGK